MEIVPTGGPLGARVEDVNLGASLSAETVAMIRAALLQHLVLIFRDQSLTEEEQVRFTRYFGRPEEHVRKLPRRGLPEIFVVSNVTEDGEPVGALGNGELTFHSDLSYMEVPGALSIVHAIEVPEEGGDTQWSNAYAAYDAMDDVLRKRVLGLCAIHRHGEEAQNPAVPVAHPVIRTHPDTGRRATYVSPQFTRSLQGVSARESESLLSALLAHVTRPEFVWNHKWRAGDLVMWDNRCTMHRREPFSASQRRILKRTQIFGDPPVLQP